MQQLPLAALLADERNLLRSSNSFDRNNFPIQQIDPGITKQIQGQHHFIR